MTYLLAAFIGVCASFTVHVIRYYNCVIPPQRTNKGLELGFLTDIVIGLVFGTISYAVFGSVIVENDEIAGAITSGLLGGLCAGICYHAGRKIILKEKLSLADEKNPHSEE